MRFLFGRFTLRTRFLIAMGLVLTPLVAVAVGSSLFLEHAASTLDQMVAQPVYKLQATARLQNQIRKSHGLAKEYAETPRFAARQQFESEAAAVEKMFDELFSKPFLMAQEHSQLAGARREWQHSRVLAQTLFSSTGPANRATVYQLDQRMNQIMYTLDQLYAAYYTEIGARRSDIRESEIRFLRIIAAAVSVGLVIAVFGAVWLSRSVLSPLREFEKGLAHFSNDDLSYRLQLDNQDEIGRLASEFNTMAERLMQHRHKLEELSVRDGLTGLYNRRELEKRLLAEIQRARRYTRPLSVLMLDIDHFKNVNDHYGHQAGDEVLITVSDLIQVNVRPVDVVCRYGGEELAVILPETEREGARAVAERIRATVEDSITTTPRGDMVHVTVSIGLAVFPHDGDTPAALLHAADQALYAAKQEGRNLVRSH